MDEATLRILSKMTTVSLDLETTGLQSSDEVWSGGFYSVKEGAVLNKHQSFFHINAKDEYRDLTNASQIESVLEKAHSSAEFGARQAGRGLNPDGTTTKNVLSEWAHAVINKQVTDQNSFIGKLGQELSDKRGNILLLQNVNFEDRVLSQAYASGEIPAFKAITDKFVTKGLPPSMHPSFGESFQRYLLPTNVYESRLLQANSLKELQRVYGKGEDTKDALFNYRKSSMAVLHEHTKNIFEAGRSGGTAVVDLMDMTKALYAHGALSGQIPVSHLAFGTKVDTLSKAILNQAEEHSALSDAIQQQKIFKRVSEELATIKREGHLYESPLINDLMNQIKKDKLYSTQLKDRALSVTREYLENSKDITLEGLSERLDKRFYLPNKHLSKEVHEEFSVSDYYDKMGKRLENHFDEHGKLKTNVEGVLEDLSNFGKDYKYTKTEATKSALSMDRLAKLAGHKAVKIGAGVVGAGFVGSMFFGGDKEKQKEVKYNTYDELYNNQYYGSAFADWQNRNNSHRMQ